MQVPNGLGSPVVGGMLREWTQDGFVRWLRGIRGLYTVRRDLFVDALYNTFDVERSVVAEKNGGRDVCVAYAKESGMREKGVRRPLFEFIPPTSGLFIWVSFLPSISFVPGSHIQCVDQGSLPSIPAPSPGQLERVA